MDKDRNSISGLLLEKSKEAFMMAIDFIYRELSSDPEEILSKIKDNPRGKGILNHTAYSHSGTQH